MQEGYNNSPYGGYGGYGGYGQNGQGQGGSMSPWSQMSSYFGDIGAGIGDLWDTKNPATAAQGYYNKIPGVLNSTYQPWINQGLNATQPYLNNGNAAGQNLQGQLSNLTNNPTAMMNQWGSTYQSSPGYAWKTGQALQSANQAAAAGGMAGSQAEQQNIAGTVNQLANQDYWQYLGNAQNLYSQGLQGEQQMYGIGAQTANNMYDVGGQMANAYGQNMANNYASQGNLAYSGQINQNENKGGGWGALFSGLGGLAGSASSFF